MRTLSTSRRGHFWLVEKVDITTETPTKPSRLETKKFSSLWTRLNRRCLSLLLILSYRKREGFGKLPSSANDSSHALVCGRAHSLTGGRLDALKQPPRIHKMMVRLAGIGVHLS